MTRNEFKLLYAVKKYGLQSHRKMKELADVSTGFISQSLRRFAEKKWIDDVAITKKGLDALLPYKVDNAVIMAAGMSTRFVPISLEKPKGLLVVKNDVLIERQIEQLQEAGIHDIVIVLGYKKEAFFYLENKYSGLRIIINPEYNIKNNTHTLYLARDYINNTYICSSDDYFAENPFEEYVYQSFYAAVHVKEKTNEWYMIPDSKGNIAKVRKSGTEGDIMLGHAYWDHRFSKAMLKILNADHDVGNYDTVLWEQVLTENVKSLPPMEIKVYPEETIFEFDSLDELRAFDESYISNTRSKIMKNIANVMGCQESDILNFVPIKEGISKRSFVFEVAGNKYVYRHSGEIPDATDSRHFENMAIQSAKSIGVVPTFIYMNEKEGWKISTYMEGVRTPDHESFGDSKRILNVLRALHKKKCPFEREFRPWDEVCRMEDILQKEKGGIMDREYGQIKNAVQKCLMACDSDGVESCFCNCNTCSKNWMLTDRGDTILVEWGRSGNADPGCDLGAYIMDTMWDIPNAIEFVAEYCQDKFNDGLKRHYLAYTAVISFYWYIKGLLEEADGVDLGESLYNRRKVAKNYSNYLVDRYQL